MRDSMLVTCVAALAACGAAPHYAPMATAPLAASGTIASGPGGPASPTATEIPEQLVIEGSLSVEVEEVGDVVPAIRAHVEQIGGRVINESVTGAETSWHAELKLRVPPDKVEDVVAFLAKRG